MKKKIGLLLALVFALTCALTACKPADTVVDPEVDDPPETLEENAEPANPWAEILTQNGFVSNEAAYGTSRAEWHEKFGDPALTQTSYYEDYTAEIYYAMFDEYCWCVELDYAIRENLEPSDADTPSLIRLGYVDRMNVFSGLDGKATNAYDLTNIYKGKSVAELEALNESLGQPTSQDTTKWGYIAWDLPNGTLTVMLDENSNAIYFDYSLAPENDSSSDQFLFDGSDGVYGVLDGDGDSSAGASVSAPQVGSDGSAEEPPEPVLPPEDNAVVIEGDKLPEGVTVTVG